MQGKGRGILGSNKDYPEENGAQNNNHFSRKIKADIFIDDRNIGGLPEWGLIYQMICSGKSYRRVLKESMLTDLNQEPPKKKHWWSRK